jgi:hypothetical protein
LRKRCRNGTLAEAPCETDVEQGFSLLLAQNSPHPLGNHLQVPRMSYRRHRSPTIKTAPRAAVRFSHLESGMCKSLAETAQPAEKASRLQRSGAPVARPSRSVSKPTSYRPPVSLEGVARVQSESPRAPPSCINPGPSARGFLLTLKWKGLGSTPRLLNNDTTTYRFSNLATGTAPTAKRRRRQSLSPLRRAQSPARVYYGPAANHSM